ncbi:phage tail protein [Plesiomonas shigelloides]|nr:phage tail protein [Plesiomonas shigelloides]
MALHTFGWAPRSAMEATHEPRVNAVKFGDGYEQRGLMASITQLAKYRVEFRGTKDRAKAIHEFLSDRWAQYVRFYGRRQIHGFRGVMCAVSGHVKATTPMRRSAQV